MEEAVSVNGGSEWRGSATVDGVDRVDVVDGATEPARASTASTPPTVAMRPDHIEPGPRFIMLLHESPPVRHLWHARGLANQLDCCSDGLRPSERAPVSSR